MASCAEGPFQPHHAHVGAQAGCAGRKVDPATGDGDPGASRPQCPVGRTDVGAAMLQPFNPATQNNFQSHKLKLESLNFNPS